MKNDDYLVRRCRNLRYDVNKYDYWCVSTHVCYKTICFRDLFITVAQRGPYIVVEK